MIVAGIDVGSRTTGVTLLENGRIVSYSIISTGPESTKTAYEGMKEALKNHDLSFDTIEYIVATGYGRVMVPFANKIITEISCHAKGAHWYFPTVRTVLDMGGQDCKAIRVDGEGNPIKFAMNDKCAAGTGRFLEIMADLVTLSLADFSVLPLQARNEVRISSTCAVFAKSEVISLIKRGIPKEDVIAGLFEAVAERVYGLLRQVGVEKDFIISGGIAKNIGVVNKIGKKVGFKALIPDEPQIVGALGAALFARENFLKEKILEQHD
jgi:predicted CoA-substrate-specific enzyme activase